MDVKALLREPNVVLNNFKTIGDKWVAKKKCKIYFPVHFEEKSLAEIGDTYHVLGIVGIVVEGTYAVLSVNAMIGFTPSETTTVDIDGEQYYEMGFDAGSVVIDNLNVVEKDTLPYFIYDLFISKGRIPWYIGYMDMCKLFDTAKSYSGANVGNRPEVIQLMVSIISRYKRDRNIYYREIINDRGGLVDELVFIPIKSVEYGATNEINKLGGSNFQIGVVSSLIHPSTGPVEQLEQILTY